MVDPDGDTATKTFYGDVSDAMDFAQQLRKSFVQNEAKDPKNYSIRINLYEHWSEKTVNLSLYYSVGPRSKNDMASANFYMKPLDEAVNGMIRELSKRGLNPRQVAIREQSDDLPKLRTFNDVINYTRGVESEPEVKPEPSSHNSDRVQILETLMGRSPDSFIQDSIDILRGGGSLDDERLKGIRFRMYKNNMRSEADIFRVASANRVATAYILSADHTRTVQITATEVAKRLKTQRWALDRYDQSYEQRIVTFYAVNFVHMRHTGTGNEMFKVVWYTGNPAHRWSSKIVDSLRDAVKLANEVKPEADRVTALELGDSPVGKL